MGDFVQISTGPFNWLEFNRSEDIRCRRVGIESYYRSLQDVLGAIQLGRFKATDTELIAEHLKTIEDLAQEIIGLADGSIRPSYADSPPEGVSTPDSCDQQQQTETDS